MRKSDLEDTIRAQKNKIHALTDSETSLLAHVKVLADELLASNQEIAVLRAELCEAQKPYSTYAARVEGERYGK